MLYSFENLFILDNSFSFLIIIFVCSTPIYVLRDSLIRPRFVIIIAMPCPWGPHGYRLPLNGLALNRLLLRTAGP